MRQPRLFLITLLLALLLLAPAATQGESTLQWPLRLNVGSTTAYTAPNGDVFAPDQAWSAENQAGYIGGSARNVPWWHFVGGTDTRPLHRTQRDNWGQYRVSGVQNGRYLVTLHFSEQIVHGPNFKEFDILLEGIPVLTSLDLVAEVGRDYAYIRRFVTEVVDGQLDLVAIGPSSLAALEIEPILEDGTAPPRPTDVTATSGYQSVLLDWADSPAVDIAGYSVFRANVGSSNWQPVTNSLVYGSRFEAEDNGQVAYQYAITAVDVWGNESSLSVPVTASPLSRSDIDLPILDLTVSESNLAKIQATPFSDDRVAGLLQFNGQTFPVETRFRGWLARHFPKKSWKIFFPGTSPFPGQDRINLSADYGDWSMMRGMVSVNHFAQVDTHTPHAEHMVLFLNGDYMGVYTRYEQIDESFLARTGQNPNSTIYKVLQNAMELLPSEEAYKRAFEKETNREAGYEDIIAFVELVNNTPDDTFAYEIAQALDVPAYMRYYATLVLISHVDFTWHNTYLIHDPIMDRWTVVPWDFDLTWGGVLDNQTLQGNYPINLGSHESPDNYGMPPNVLITRLLNVPQYRHYYCQQLDLFMQSSFSVPTMSASIDTAYQHIAAEGLADWRRFGWEDRAQFMETPEQMKRYVAERIVSLNAQMASYCPVEEMPLIINEIMTENETAVCDPDDPTSVDCHEPWFELYNPNLTPVNLDGYYLSNTLSNLQLSPVNGPLVVPPLGHVVIWADGEPNQGINHTNFVLAGFGSIYLTARDGSTIVAETSYSFMPEDFSNGRFPDGSDQWELFSQATPGSSNIYTAPTIREVTHTPALPDNNDSVVVTAFVADDGPLFVPDLFYQVNGGGFISTFMSPIGGDFYSATIPAQPDVARVEYYILAQDRDGGRTTYPETAPNLLREYRIDYEAPPLVINEFMANNDSFLTDPAEASEYPDWIEIYNPSPHTVDLGGLMLTDDLTEPDKFTFSDELSLGPGGFILIYADRDPEQGNLHANFRLSASGETIGLFDNGIGDHQLLDSYGFGIQTADVSQGRCPDGANWTTQTTPSPSVYNHACDNTPPRFVTVAHTPTFPAANDTVVVETRLGATGSDLEVQLWYTTSTGDNDSLTMEAMGGGDYQVTLPNFAEGTTVAYYLTAVDSHGEATSPLMAPDYDYRFKMGYERPLIHFNELMARNGTKLTDPDEPTERPDWFELYNSSDEAIDLSGFYLTDDLASPRQYRISDGVVIQPGGFLVFYADDDSEQGARHTNFTLSSGGEVLGLYAPDGDVLVDTVTFEPLRADLSYQRSVDGAGRWQIDSCTSPGSSNGCGFVVYLPIVIR
ncbi:MAG: CotH kinase family protein [Chloroflexota bacterium]